MFVSFLNMKNAQQEKINFNWVGNNYVTQDLPELPCSYTILNY